MDKLKEPAMILSVANSFGLVGASVYFYKQMEVTRSDIGRLAMTLQKALAKITDLEKRLEGAHQTIQHFNKQIEQMNVDLENANSLDYLENIETDLDEIVSTLEDHDIRVERPSLISSSSRSGSKRNHHKPANQKKSRPREADSRSRKIEAARSRVSLELDEDDDMDLIGAVRERQSLAASN